MRLATVTAALQILGETGALTADLAAAGISVLVLRGAPVQRRFLGSPSAYRSADIDLLVHRSDAPAVRRLLGAQGWRFAAENSVLWRLDRAAAFTRGVVTIDLHWGLHAHGLLPGRMKTLEAALWSEATRAPEGWWEPAPAPLLVYLAVHAAGKSFANPDQRRLLAAVAGAVQDWDQVTRLAESAWMRSAVAAARDLTRSGDEDRPSVPVEPWPALERMLGAVRTWLRVGPVRVIVGRLRRRVVARGAGRRPP